MIRSVWLLSLVLLFAGCGGCTPADAYTTPAHWDQAYYSQESVFDHYTYYRQCSRQDYYNSSGHLRSHYVCQTVSRPVYRYYRQYHAAVYHPSEFHPAVKCAKS